MTNKPWQVTLHFSNEIGMLTIRVQHHTHAMVSFTNEAAEYCGGAAETDEDGYIVRCNDEPDFCDTAREIARMSEEQ